MPVTEVAQLTLQLSTDVSSPSLLANLAKAKSVMEKASGFEFRYYHSVEEPNVIFILGAWPSVDFHMQEFIPGQPNQEVLELLKDMVTVDWMFHLDLDQSEKPLPLKRAIIAIARHFVRDGDKDGFNATFEDNKHELEAFTGGSDQVVGGWRLDKGFDPSITGDKGKDEFVLFTGWDTVEQHFDFAKTEGYQKYSQIRNHINGAESKHAMLLDAGKVKE